MNDDPASVSEPGVRFAGDGTDRARGPRAASGTAAATPHLRAVAVCDLADSTALVERLGDRRAAELFRRHDRVVRDLLLRHGGQEIDKTDGFLVLFARPIAAVAFALDYQRALRELGAAEQCPLQARVGLHVGDVLVWENDADDIAHGAKRIEVEGLAKPVAARLMSLARPGQVLLSGMCFSLAQRAAGELGQRGAPVRWQTHGRYRFKGVPTPMLVHEVGEAGVAPLTPPGASDKAQRELPVWQRRNTIGLGAAGLLGIVLVLVFALTSQPQPAIAFGERDWVLVGDLRNLTGDPDVADALDAAFRISLEQSRFVNVLPDLTVRAALERMQRPAEATIDREIGSELALREGVRALILPTVAEIGGRVRVSAEVIDPHTATTVYAEAADGLGIGSSLVSMDTVSAALRARLGETLQAIRADSAPLPRVTSASTEALKAYARAQQAVERMQLVEALRQFDAAIAIDPQFALAHIGRARVLFMREDAAAAAAAVATAAGIKERLTARDALYVDAWSATMVNGRQAVERWAMMSTLHPDDFVARYNHASLAWQYANDPGACAAGAPQLDQPQNPHRESGIYLLATCLLAEDRLQEAAAQFSRAEALDSPGHNLARKDQPAIRGEFAGTLQALSTSTLLGEPGRDVELHMAHAVVLLDAGRGAEARRAMAQALATRPQLSAERARVVTIQALVLDALQGRLDVRGTDFSAAVDEAANADPAAARGAAVAALQQLAWLAAYSGETDVAEAVLARGPATLADGIDNEVRALARAEIALQRGQPASALASLRQPTPTALIQTEAARARAVLAEGRHAEAERLALALARRRGRAYGELGHDWPLRPANIVAVRSAWLLAAEAALLRGDHDAAARHLAGYRRHWATDAGTARERERLRALEERLTPPGSSGSALPG